MLDTIFFSGGIIQARNRLIWEVELDIFYLSLFYFYIIFHIFYILNILLLYFIEILLFLPNKAKNVQAEQKFNFAQLCLNVVRSSKNRTVLELELIYEKVDCVIAKVARIA